MFNKSKLIKIASIVLCLFLMVCCLICISCKKEEDEIMSIANIDWSISEKQIDAKNTVVMTYKNNSSFTIIGVEIEFRLKENLTSEELSIFDKYDYLSEQEKSELYITAYNGYFVKRNQISSVVPCSLVGTFNYCHDFDEYKLMEPSEVTVSYIKNNKIYGFSYDYKTKKTTQLTSTGVDAFEWSNNDLAKLIPKPTKQVVSVGFDWNDMFSFNIYDANESDFDKYIQEFMVAGFDINVDESDYFGYKSYMAENKDKIKVHLYYMPFDNYSEPNEISVTVEKNKNQFI